MELVCPAGSAEKLEYAYAYGADTAYIGLERFSLRAKADNFHGDDFKKVCEIKSKFPNKKLFCAMNIAFHQKDLDSLKANLDLFRKYPIDAFIVQDLGVVRFLQKEFPNAHLHLSTQASCINAESAKMYRDLGFKRIVLGREASLSEIRKIKDEVPEMELECFAHGAMCIAYSGRCLMSAYLTDRSAQAGLCSHVCRWNFDLKSNAQISKSLAESGELVIEEDKRRGEYFPVFEGENFTAILSSRDLRMIEHLKEMQDAGVDAVKIEGRMKSVYYCAIVTRAYRKALDELSGKLSAEEAAPFVKSLDDAAHRESTTGFYFSSAEANKTTVGASSSQYLLAATVSDAFSAEKTDSIFEEGNRLFLKREEEFAKMHPAALENIKKDEALHPEKKIVAAQKKDGWNLYPINALNKIEIGTPLEAVSPSVVCAKIAPDEYEFVSPKTGLKLAFANDGHDCAIYTKIPLSKYTLLRMKDERVIENPGKR